MYTRRQFGILTAGAGTALAATESKINGVMIGAQTYSFRDRSLDDCIRSMIDVGLTYAEVWSGHVQPRPKMQREELRQWRVTLGADEMPKVRRKFRDAGIDIYAFNYPFRDDFSDEEIESGFEMAKALDTKIITASANVTTARRLDPFARRHKIRVGMHNHSRIRPNEFARPEDFEEALRGASKYIAINFDVGHFFGAGFDPVAFLDRHHERIVTLHVKDKTKKDENVPFGQGDTPLKEIMHLLRRRKFKIPAMIEYEYKGEDTVAEVRKCYDYLRALLTEA
jgi:sugar phosphate isomerase/epimerase